MFKQLLSLAFPIAGSQCLNVASQFICMLMLASLSPHILAASALIFSIQISITVTSLSLLFALSILVAHAYGNHNYSEIGFLLKQGWQYSFWMSIPLMILFWNIHHILLWCGQPAELTHLIKAYFHTYVWSVFPTLLAVCHQQVAYGLQQKRMIIISSLFSVIILLIASYLLLFKTTLGVAGLGIAMTIQAIFYFIITYIYFHSSGWFKKIYGSCTTLSQQIHTIWSIGWPISLQIGGELLSFSINTVMVGWLGIVALSAYQVVNQYCFLVIVPIFSLSQATSILIGMQWSNKQFDKIKSIAYTSLYLVIFITSIIAMIFILMPNQLTLFYTHHHLIPGMVAIFSIMAVGQIIDGIRNVLLGILRGMLDVKFPMMINLIMLWLVGIPFSYFFAFTLHWDVVGIIAGWLLGIFFSVVMMWYRLRLSLRGTK